GALGCECPPAPAVGRHLLLDFAPKGTRSLQSSCQALQAEAESGKRKAESGKRKAPDFRASLRSEPGAAWRPSGRNKGGRLRDRRRPGAGPLRLRRACDQKAVGDVAPTYATGPCAAASSSMVVSGSPFDTI